MDRNCAILLNFSSLPSDFAIGDFNDKAIDEIISGLKKMGIKRWQTLPVTITGKGNSPYSGVSSFAGNPLYIDPYKLIRDGYISYDEVKKFTFSDDGYLVNYDEAEREKSQILRICYDNKKAELKQKLANFVRGKSWLNNYAVFMTAKKVFDGKAWYEWDKGLRDRKQYALRKFKKENLDLFYYFVFEQYIFAKQYREIKKKINSEGIKIIGDMPFYVDYDSVDVWYFNKDFMLDKDKKPKLVSAVPPDAFCKDGQLWNNPVYDFAAMEKNNFRYFRQRITLALRRYDALRLDHFRGFSSFYAVKYGAKSAKGGKWYNGPGMKFINILKDKFKRAEFIAEDLGTIDKKALKLCLDSGFAQTRVLGFAFDSANNEHLPHNYTQNCVAYTATHDNMTTLGFLQNAPEDKKLYVYNYCRITDKNDTETVKQMMTYLIASNARTVVFPVQDILVYGNDTRMNVPGKPQGNWVYRLTFDAWKSIDYGAIAWQNYVYSR